MANKKMTKIEWLEANGFSQDGVTYLVLGNSYPIKNALKDEGFKFSPLLRWHCGDRAFELPETCYYKQLHYDEVFIWNEEEGTTYLQDGAREKIELIFNPIVESNSDYVGEVGDRLRNLSVVVRNIAGFDSPFGYKWIYTFEDEEGNRYSWFTTTQKGVSINMTVSLSGTIKAHSEYKGVKTTQLTRCRLVED